MLFRAEPAAELARNAGRLNDLLNALLVDRMPFFSPVQIDDMEKGRSLVHPCPSHGRWIIAVDGFLGVVSLPQSHTLPAANVDGWKDEHKTPLR